MSLFGEPFSFTIGESILDFKNEQELNKRLRGRAWAYLAFSSPLQWLREAGFVYKKVRLPLFTNSRLSLFQWHFCIRSSLAFLQGRTFACLWAFYPVFRRDFFNKAQESCNKIWENNMRLK